MEYYIVKCKLALKSVLSEASNSSKKGLKAVLREDFLNQLKTLLFGNQYYERPCCMRPRYTYSDVLTLLGSSIFLHPFNIKTKQCKLWKQNKPIKFESEPWLVQGY